MKTKLFTLFVALIATTALWAYDCKIDGIYYNLNSTNLTAEVTFESYGSLSYSGSIVIPSTITYNAQTYSVTTIGERAFDFCTDLTSVTIPNSVTTIGYLAFCNCTGLMSVTIPNSVTTIEESAFRFCTSLTSFNVNPANTHYCSIDGVLFNYAKDMLIQYPISNTQTEYTIPNSVTSIEGYAFASCSNLTSITIPNSVKTIGEMAFYNSGLTSVIVCWTNVNELPIMGSYVFLSIANMSPAAATLHVPEGTKSIYENADQWKDFGMITDDAIPDSNTITYTATEKLTNPYLMIGWTTFGPAIISHTFSNGTGTITCEGEITKIGEMAFSDCKSLTSIAIPNSVTTIEDYAFQSCYSLTSIAIGKSITTIGERAFLRCDALISIDVDAANTHYCSIDGVLFNYAKDTLIQYPASNTRTKYTIPNSVTTLGYSAFRECSSLTSVTIPNSVTTIGECAFYYATSLTSVIVNWTDVNELPIMGDVVFMGIANLEGPSAATLHVPEGTKSIYEAADQWKDFGTITDSQVDEGNEVDMKPFITYQDQTGTFDYPYYPSWSDNSGQLRIFRDNGLQDLNLEAGVSKIIFHKTASTIGQIWIGDPNWNQLATVADWEGGLTTLEYVLDEAAIKCITDETSDGWSETAFILMGDGLEVTKIAIVPGTDQTSVVGKQFVDAISGLKFKITAVGEVNNVKVISNNGVDPTYSGDVVIPSTVNYHDTTFTVTQIGSNAFAGCSNLTSVTIPSSVTTIGYNAFYDCTGLISVTIPNSVTTIGDDAFYLVNNIVYNGTATGSPWGAKCVNGYVDGYLVYSDASKTILCGCSTAATGEIVIPNSVTTIGDKAFVGCSGLTSPVYNNSCFAYMPTSYQGAYTIPDGIKQIAGYAFFWCVSLTSVTIPNSVTTIGDYAFGYSGLTSINLPDSITTIGKGVFEYCDGLTSITIPNSVRTIDDYAFSYCKGLVSITIPDSVTTIGMMTFYVCESLTSITIPYSVTAIGKWAFNYCYSLTSIDIPNSVTTIGDYAFASCGLKDVSVNWTSDEQLPSMGWGVFEGIADWGGPSAATLHVPEGTKSIYENADQWKEFGTITDEQYNPENCVITYTATEKLTNPYLEVGWTTFGPAIISHTFSNGIGTITCGGEITKIGDMAFAFSGLTSINIPNSVTTIEGMAFYNCANLTSITIPTSVTSIGRFAFYWCYSLTSIDVDAANTHYCSIDGVLFNYAKDTLIQHPIGNTRTEYTIPNSVTTIEGSAFSSCSGLTSVTIPNSVATIGERAFEDCPNLISVTIPNLVTTIEDLTFWGCSGLISIIIPNSVTTIGDGAFGNCSSLTTITCYAVTPPKCGDDVFANVFEYISQNTKVYVPASALVDYQNAEVWKDMLLLPIAADVTPMDDENPIVTPTDQDVTITWAITDGADTYTLTITKDGETVCVLTFNADGQLTNIAFAAPGHNGARQAPAATRTTQGFQFTVTGLDPGTAYEYSVTTTNAEGQTIAEQKGNFNTTGGTGLKPVRDSQCTMHKYFHNGNLIIERNGIKYTATGQKVR